MVAAAVEPGFRIAAGNPVDHHLNRGLQGFAGAGLCLAQFGFELAPTLFKGRKIGRVRWQKQHLVFANQVSLLLFSVPNYC